MREIAEALREWRAVGRTFAIATVVAVRGSAPRPPGAAMAVAADGEVVGSVSGGCVEGAVHDSALEALRQGGPRLEHFGFTDADAFAVGLTCGGDLDIGVIPYPTPARSPADAGAGGRSADVPGRVPPGGEATDGEALDGVLAALATDEAVALITVLGGAGAGDQAAVWPTRAVGALRSPGLDATDLDDARRLLAAGAAPVRRQRPGRAPAFVQTFLPAPRMLVFGAADHAAAMARMGRFLGFRVTVCDARPVFATARRFPDADEVVCAQPAAYLARSALDARTAICVLTHDPKFDLPLLQVALRTPAGYVGAMGSRRTHADRLDRLRANGMTEAELARLHAPIGLDLGAHTPQETAVSIAAEIIASRRGGSGRPLRVTRGAIHAAPDPYAAPDPNVAPAPPTGPRRH
ncbi:xanthine dehydrogenase accessory factor [Frankia sp. AiPs1]|uniref:XdhC family protein n=1 Tax=Frankia sp. AiPa1 TaxID=573492 RepID=UPI00202AD545|nr:XdhC/CoxI family protein [Frankia sp. AiPa1]MCL9762061.1 XdhC family protein [Frankia sp. AiPa1]